MQNSFPIERLKRKISISETNYKNYNQALVEGAVSVLEIQTVKEKLIEWTVPGLSET